MIGFSSFPAKIRLPLQNERIMDFIEQITTTQQRLPGSLVPTLSFSFSILQLNLFFCSQFFTWRNQGL